MAEQSDKKFRALLAVTLVEWTELMEELQDATMVDSDDLTNGTSSETVTSVESRSKKTTLEHGECSGSRQVSKNSTKKKAQLVYFPTPDLPESYKRLINGVGGTDVMLVMQKRLFRTDVEANNGRLSMPLSHVRQEFLTEEERKFLNDQFNKTVRMIEPSMKERSITLRQWDMKKKESGKGSSMYVLKSEWNKVVKDNQLKTNDIIQIWSFRVGEELRLALVFVERGVEDADDDEQDGEDDD